MAHRPTAIVLLCCSTALAACGGPNESSATGSPRFRIVTSVETDAFSVRGQVGVERDELTAAELSAACQTLIDWKSDLALGLDLLVSSDEALLRSAELLDGDFAGSRPALRAEELVVRETSPAAIVARVADEQGGSAGQVADSYLRARALPPSPDAASRYVAYATPRTAHEVLVVRMEIDPPPRTDDPLGRETIRLRRSTGDAIAIDPAWCA